MARIDVTPIVVTHVTKKSCLVPNLLCGSSWHLLDNGVDTNLVMNRLYTVIVPNLWMIGVVYMFRRICHLKVPNLWIIRVVYMFSSYMPSKVQLHECLVGYLQSYR